MSSLIEKLATASEKREGFDLADYLIKEQTAMNKFKVMAYVCDREMPFASNKN